VKELEAKNEKKLEELRKKSKEDLENQEKNLQAQKAKELK